MKKQFLFALAAASVCFMYSQQANASSTDVQCNGNNGKTTQKQCNVIQNACRILNPDPAKVVCTWADPVTPPPIPVTPGTVQNIGSEFDFLLAPPGKPEPEKPAEVPLKNDFRILLMSSPTKYNENDPALKGLNYILTLKENGQYKYYYAVTNMASVKDINLKTAKDAGFRNAFAVGFMPNQRISMASP